MRDQRINIFYSEEDGGYIADIPDLEACSAFGQTPAEAWSRCREAGSPVVGGGLAAREGDASPPVPSGHLPGGIVKEPRISSSACFAGVALHR